MVYLLHRMLSNERKKIRESFPGPESMLSFSIFFSERGARLKSVCFSCIKALHVHYTCFFFLFTCTVIITLWCLWTRTICRWFLSFYITDCFSFTVMTSSGIRSWTWSLTGVRCVQLGGGTKHGPLNVTAYWTPYWSPFWTPPGPFLESLLNSLLAHHLVP